MTGIKAYPIRLRPGEDLYESLMKSIVAQNIAAAFVLTCVGSLTRVCVRYADQHEAVTLQGPFEIVSLVGTLGVEGCHLHILFSDENGITRGGHLKPGSLVYTTAEVVVGLLEATKFSRKKDAETGFSELLILKT